MLSHSIDFPNALELYNDKIHSGQDVERQSSWESWSVTGKPALLLSSRAWQTPQWSARLNARTLEPLVVAAWERFKKHTFNNILIDRSRCVFRVSMLLGGSLVSPNWHWTGPTCNTRPRRYAAGLPYPLLPTCGSRAGLRAI